MSRTTRRQGEQNALAPTAQALTPAEGLTTGIVGPLFWETLPSGMLDHDLPSWRAYTGQPPFPNGTGWLEPVVHPADLERTRLAWASAVATVTGIAIEHRLCGADGTYRTFLTQSTPEFAPDGQLSGWRGVSVDLSASKREEQLDRWRSQTFVANHDAVIITDAQGCIIDWNPAAERMYGYLRDDVLGEATTILLVPDEQATITQAIRDTLVLMKMWHGELTYVCKDGARGVCESTVNPVFDDQGQVVGAFAVSRDITTRKTGVADMERLLDQERANRSRLEAALTAAQVSEARFQKLIDNNIIGVNIADSDHIIEANDAFLHMLGYSRAELEAGAIAWKTLTPPEFRAADDRAVTELVQRGACVPYEKVYLRKDGTPVPIILCGVLLDWQPLRVASFILDLTERKLAEAEREVLLDREQQARRAAEAERARLEAVLDVLPAGVIIADATGNITHVNQAFHDVWGDHAVASSMAEYRVYRGWYPDGQKVPVDGWAMSRALQSGETVHDQEIDILAFDGTRKTILNNAVPLYDETGNINGGVVAFLDITARRSSAREAHARAAELEAVIETMADAVFVYNAEGGLVRTNAAARALNPQTTDEAYLQKHYDDRLVTLSVRDAGGHRIDADETPLARAMRGERLTAMDSQMQSITGQTVHLSSSAAPIFASAGDISGAVLVVRDVTARHLQERAAVEQAAEYQAVFDAINDAIFVFNLDGSIRRINAAASKIYGLNADPAYAQRLLAERAALLNISDAQGNPFPNDRWGTPFVLAGGTINSDEGPDMRLDLPDGRTVLLNSSGGPIFDPLGQQIGAVAVSRDVTTRRQLERRTHDSLESLLQMAETLVQRPEGAAFSEGNQVAQRLAELTCRVLACKRVSITGIEPATERLVPLGVAGLPPDQETQWWAEQRALDVHLPDLDKSTPDFLPQMLAGEVVVYDLTQPPFNAAPNPYGVTVMAVAPMRLGTHLIGWLALDHGGAVLPFAPDELRLASAVAQLIALVVERERLLAEREATHAEVLALAAANRRMDSFLGIASHELRTPLTSVKANLQLTERAVDRFLQTHQPPDPKLARSQDLLRRTVRHLARLDRLIEDLLDVTRIQEGGLPLKLEDCDLVALVQEAVEEQQAAWPLRAITLAVSADAIPLWADGGRIGQVVVNFLTNALKYSEFDCPVAVRVTEQVGQVRVAVQDRGPGLPPEEQARIWDRFHRAPGIEVLSGSGVGLGLGLHICKTIITGHGGQIGVDSAPGAGSTFWFTLPLRAEEAQI